MSWLALVLVGLVVGSLLGLVGAGGGIVAVPGLMLLGGASAAEASALSLAAVTAGSLVGLLGRRGGGPKQAVDWRSVIGFLVAGIPAAAWGAATAPLLPNAVLTWLLISILLVALWRQLAGIRQRRRAPAKELVSVGAGSRPPASGMEEEPTCAAGDDAPFPVSCWVNRAIVGASVGYLTGLLGVGGGFLIVPALTILLGLSMRRAASTSLAIIVGTSASGIATHLLNPSAEVGVNYPAQALVLAGATALVAFVAARLSRRLSESLTRSVFLAALCVAIAGLAISALVGALG